jgi:hypothetical protein
MKEKPDQEFQADLPITDHRLPYTLKTKHGMTPNLPITDYRSPITIFLLN